jgi:hypothetical protein
VRGAERIDRPAAVFAVGDQRTDANDRMVDVLGELVAQLGANLVVALTLVAVGGAKPLRSGTVSISQTITLVMFKLRLCASASAPFQSSV